MKQLSCRSILRAIGSLLVILLFANCKKEEISIQPNNPESATEFQAESQSIGLGQILSQTRTANSFFEQTIYNWRNALPQYLSKNDNLFTYSQKINTVNRAFLVMQDFRFEIPQTATITNIIVGTSRYKKGKASLKDCFVHLVRNNEYNGWSPYGVQMAKPDLWKTTETEVVYTQPGKGNNGLDMSCLCSANSPYEWKPEAINGNRFGIYMLTSFPDGGIIEVYYDQIQITVEYSMP